MFTQWIYCVNILLKNRYSFYSESAHYTCQKIAWKIYQFTLIMMTGFFQKRPLFGRNNPYSFYSESFYSLKNVSIYLDYDVCSKSDTLELGFAIIVNRLHEWKESAHYSRQYNWQNVSIYFELRWLLWTCRFETIFFLVWNIRPRDSGKFFRLVTPEETWPNLTKQNKQAGHSLALQLGWLFAVLFLQLFSQFFLNFFLQLFLQLFSQFFLQFFCSSFRSSFFSALCSFFRSAFCSVLL